MPYGLPDYERKSREHIHDLYQWIYQDEVNGEQTRALRVLSALSGTDGPSGVATPVKVTPDGALVTTTTLSGIDATINLKDGLNQYGEIDTLSPSSSANIVTIDVPSDKKINIMGYSAEGSGLGDYKLMADGATQTRKIQRKALEGNFGINGISFEGPKTVVLNVRNVETSLTTPCKNKNHMYFGNIYYNLEDK